MDSRLVEALKEAYESRGASPKESLLDQMIRERLQFCLNSCQNNKVVCMLRPKCENRRFLDVLLLVGRIGHSLQKFPVPSFCYSQRISQYERFFKDGFGNLPPDTYITIEDLLTILTGRKKKGRERTLRGISTTLAKTIGRGPYEFTEKVEDSQIILAQGHLAILDEKANLCLLNPQREPIRTKEVLNAITKILCKKHNFKVVIEAAAAGILLNLNAEFNVESDEQLFDISDLIVGHDENKIVVEVPISPLEREIKLSVGELVEIFENLGTLASGFSEPTSDDKKATKMLPQTPQSE